MIIAKTKQRSKFEGGKGKNGKGLGLVPFLQTVSAQSLNSGE